jgi:DNA-binding NarL/FixJ family response regulator
MECETDTIIAAREQLLRDGLACIAESAAGVRVVAKVGSGLDAVRECRRLQPDLLIAEEDLAQIVGLVVARTVSCGPSPVPVILVLEQTQKSAIAAARQAGASGILSREDGGEELKAAMEAAIHGDSFLGPSLATDTVIPRAQKPDTLTSRELQVAALVAQGHRNKEIATLLGIRPKTVDSHRTNIMKKLGFHSTAELTRYVIQERLL